MLPRRRTFRTWQQPGAASTRALHVPLSSSHPKTSLIVTTVLDADARVDHKTTPGGSREYPCGYWVCAFQGTTKPLPGPSWCTQAPMISTKRGVPLAGRFSTRVMYPQCIPPCGGDNPYLFGSISTFSRCGFNTRDSSALPESQCYGVTCKGSCFIL